MEENYSERPWGNYRILFKEDGFWVKRIEVKPQARLSLQKHGQRLEKWVIVKGKGYAVVDGKEIPVGSGVLIEIPLGAVHRIANNGKEPLVFIEVAMGSHLSEDDIIRLQDDYQRT